MRPSSPPRALFGRGYLTLAMKRVHAGLMRVFCKFLLWLWQITESWPASSARTSTFHCGN